MKGLLTSLITVLTFTGLQAQSLPAAPKLVVGLTIDQLRTDYLEAFSSLYGEKGFKRLWKEGRVFHNAEYTFSGVDRASAIAAIYSGTTPSMNGIISKRWMDAATLRPVNSTDDTAFMGYYTDQTVAPTKLLTSTIADELKIATQGKGLVYAIAPQLRRRHFCRRTCRKRCFLAQSQYRKMERDNLLRRISLVGKSIQRPPGCRFPYRRHDMGTGFPAGDVHFPARLAGYAFQI